MLEQTGPRGQAAGRSKIRSAIFVVIARHFNAEAISSRLKNRLPHSFYSFAKTAFFIHATKPACPRYLESRTLALAASFILLSGCSLFGSSSIQDSAPENPRSVTHVKNAVPKKEPKSRYGNPSSYEVFGKEYYVMDSALGYKEHGIASWYGTKFHGNRTSSGEPYDMYQMTAAHKTLPLPTYARVTNTKNNRSIIVKINDRGPFHDNRIIDLSYAAAVKLDVLSHGTAPVVVEAILPGEDEPIKQYQAKLSVPKAKTIAPSLSQTYLQVGAFSQKNSAEQILSRLQKQFSALQVQIKFTETEQPVLYKVQIGPLSDDWDIQKISQQLSSFMNQEPMVVVQ